MDFEKIDIFKKIAAFYKRENRYKALAKTVFMLALAYWLLLVFGIVQLQFAYGNMGRKILFFLLIASFVGLLVFLYGNGIRTYFGKKNFDFYIGKAKTIQQLYKQIDDKLVNSLQLIEKQFIEDKNIAIIEAAIAQKLVSITPIVFIEKLKLKAFILKYLRFIYLTIIVLVFSILGFPEVFTVGTKDIIYYNKTDSRYGFITINLLNDSLAVRKGTDFELRVGVGGSYVPNDVFIQYGEQKYYSDLVSASEYSYQFRNVNDDIPFRIVSENYQSELFLLKALPTPELLGFKVLVSPPKYTGMESFSVEGQTYLEVPKHASVQFVIETEETLESVFTYGNEAIVSEPENMITNLEFEADSSFRFGLVLKNEFVSDTMLSGGSVIVKEDRFPDIEVGIATDSIQPGSYFFAGNISDDYGFTKLQFNIMRLADSMVIEKVKLPINYTVTEQQLFLTYELQSLSDSKLAWFFSVKDNDPYGGFKETRTVVVPFDLSSQKELSKASEESNRGVSQKLTKAEEMSKDFQKSLADFKQAMTDEQVTKWDKKQHIKELLKEHNKFEKNLEELKKEMERNIKLSDLDKTKKEELQAKQEQLKKMLDELMTDEIRDLLDKISELEEQFNRDKYNDLNEKLDQSYDQLEKQLDRTMELFKRYSIEQDMNKAIDRLDKMLEQEALLDSLANEKKLSENFNKELLDKLKKDNKAVDDLLKKAGEKNKELQRPMQMQEKQQELNEIEQSLEKRTQMLEQNKQGKKGKERKNTKQKMEELRDELNSMMQQMFKEEAAENYETIRQILDNLMLFSQSQEAIWSQIGSLDKDNPQLAQAYIDQTNMYGYFKLIEDSLLALGKRTFQLNSLINKEVYEITTSFSTINSKIADTNYSGISNPQRDIVEHANNLALLLNQSMQDMDSQPQGSGCGKPKKGKKPKPGLGDLQKQQQSLEKSLQNYLDALKKNGNSKQGLGKQQADVLQQQEMFNQMLEELQKSGKFNPESQTILNEIRKQAQESIKDIVQNSISGGTLYRQNQIKTRLLEAQKAERERELDDERKSSTAHKYEFSIPDELKYDEKTKNRFNEDLSYENLKFYYFYKNKYKEYLNKLVK